MKIGVDLVYIPRLIKSLNPDVVSKILSPSEIRHYGGLPKRRSEQYIAGRFAAKEAIIKCFDPLKCPMMCEIEIVNNNSEPQVNYKDHIIQVSISHEEDYAIAMAIVM